MTPIPADCHSPWGMDVFIAPAIRPVRYTGPDLPTAERRRLVEAITSSRTLAEAAERYGTDRRRLESLARREGFGGLLQPLRYPLGYAVRTDPAKRDRLVQMIEEGRTYTEIGAFFGVTGWAVKTYLVDHSLDDAYRQARGERERRERMAKPPRLGSNRVREAFQIAAMLAGRGVTVSGSPAYRHGSLIALNLLVDGEVVRFLHPTRIVKKHFYHVHPQVSNAWHLAITPDRFVVAYAPPHFGRSRYLPADNPARALYGRTPPRYVWHPDEWPDPRSLGLK